MAATTTERSAAGLQVRQMLNKVPEVTIYFWIIKVLCTTVGETASDYLAGDLSLGLTKTTFITSAALVVTLVFQFRAWRYVPSIYWLAVVLISIVGTQITDNLTDNVGVSLVITTIVFSVLLAVTFTAWYASERTLSIHTIFTTRREAFYWLAVLFTFALGTAAGDLAAERLNLGYALSTGVFAAGIALVAVAHYRFALNAVAAFWIAYILTRPLGASLGDYLSQVRADGGLGLGATMTSALFLAAIVIVVAYLSVTRKDATEARLRSGEASAQVLVVAPETVAVAPALLEAIRQRAARSPARFHLLVPNPAEHAESTDAERREKHAEGEHVLARALPLIGEAAGGSADGSVSIRHDPMDGIEETLQNGDFKEIILSTRPHTVERWLHVDLPHRVARFGLPVITVISPAVAEASGPPAVA
jgi:uncharacterized membrane-anchored protein